MVPATASVSALPSPKLKPTSRLSALSPAARSSKPSQFLVVSLISHAADERHKAQANEQNRAQQGRLETDRRSGGKPQPYARQWHEELEQTEDQYNSVPTFNLPQGTKGQRHSQVVGPDDSAQDVEINEIQNNRIVEYCYTASPVSHSKAFTNKDAQ